ncbi:MAG: DNA starvation/stationary phase protection protein [Prevotella sp.]|jgi:starvation-inducible DNA-binding protein|nr:DNA starvation/stationary phase protection protein [Prevotella sp.]MCI1281271.1 DNA starvation/stationary phase protection protein [Prevotella sp.]
MKTLDYIKLDENRVNNVVDALAQLLADLQVYYNNLHGFHWNVKGKGFFVLHEKYEELYDDAAAKVDEIAERILQLGGTPENRQSKVLKRARVKESGFEPQGKEGLEEVLKTIGLFTEEERVIGVLADEIGDNVTKALMDDYLKGQEKLVWMLTSFLTCPKKNE